MTVRKPLTPNPPNSMERLARLETAVAEIATAVAAIGGVGVWRRSPTALSLALARQDTERTKEAA